MYMKLSMHTVNDLQKRYLNHKEPYNIEFSVSIEWITEILWFIRCSSFKNISDWQFYHPLAQDASPLQVTPSISSSLMSQQFTTFKLLVRENQLCAMLRSKWLALRLIQTFVGVQKHFKLYMYLCSFRGKPLYRKVMKWWIQQL